MPRIFIIAFAFIFAFSNIVEAKEVSSVGRYEYFTQDKNITNLSTQLPAKKGLLKKSESGQIRSVGNYQKVVGAPRTRLDIKVRIELDKNVLTVNYITEPNIRNMSSRIPISQQLFQETVGTHVYLVFPKSLSLINEVQAISAINNTTERDALLSACAPENTKLSEFLRKCNAAMEGTYELTMDERTQLERMFDNLSDVAGKYGKTAKSIKTGVKYAIKRKEKKIIRKLEEKYGADYLIYKVPIYVPEGISMTYSHIGRINKFFFDASRFNEADKIFVEIPTLNFEVNMAGAVRRASLEELAYEIMVEPYSLPEPNYTVESLYGEWEDVDYSSESYSNRLIISKNRIRQQHNPRGEIISTDKSVIISPRGKNNTEYVMKEESGVNHYIEIVSPNVICYERETLKKTGAQEPKAVPIDKIIGTWEVTKGKSHSTKVKINKNILILEKTKFSRFFNKVRTTTAEFKILKTTKIGNIYFIKTICVEENDKRVKSVVFCVKMKSSDIIYIPQLSVQLRRKASYQIEKPTSPIPFGAITLTYVCEDFNIACMKLQTDGTFSIGDEQINGNYKIEGINGRYKVRGDVIIFTKNNGNKIMEAKIEDNFLIDPNGERWTRIK